MNRVLFLIPKNVQLFLFLFIFSFSFSHSQPADTLAMVKQIMAVKQFDKAEKLLKPYYEKHPGNLNAQWIYAQAAYGAKHYKRARVIYENAIRWHPENYTLRLDYAKKMVDIGEFEKAIPVLNLYLAYDSIASDVHEALAKISFWSSEYKTALSEVDKVLRKHPDNASLRNLRREILLAKSPWLKINAGYGADDQPFRKITPSVETGVWLNPLANLTFSFQSPVFLRDKNYFSSQSFTTGNKIVLNKPGIELNIEGGIIKLPNNQISGIAGVKVSKTFLKHMVLSVNAEQQSYLYTRANMENPIMKRNYSFALAWDKSNSWQGKAAFDINDFYSDNNFVYTSNIWLLSPVVKILRIDSRLGYSFNFSTAKGNRFVSEKSLTDVVSGWSTGSLIPGIYNPYFTPNEQSAHSLILALTIHPSKFIETGVKGNICFSGATSNPYLYLTKDANNQFLIERGYSRLGFFPTQINAYLAAQITPKISLKCEYLYTKNNFYTSSYAGLSLKISFWNEKKAK